MQFHAKRVLEAIRKKNWKKADAGVAEAEKTLPKEDINWLRSAIVLAERDYVAGCGVAERIVGSKMVDTAKQEVHDFR